MARVAVRGAVRSRTRRRRSDPGGPPTARTLQAVGRIALAGLRGARARRRAPPGDLSEPRRRDREHRRRARRRGRDRHPDRHHLRGPHRGCAGCEPLARPGSLRVRRRRAGEPGRAPGGARRCARASAVPGPGRRECAHRRDRPARAGHAGSLPAGTARPRGRQPAPADAGAGAAGPRGAGGRPARPGAVPRRAGRRVPAAQLRRRGLGPAADRGADGARAGGAARRRHGPPTRRGSRPSAPGPSCRPPLRPATRSPPAPSGSRRC